ncbi:chorismate--pyruvate lyase family protein [Dactylosporangium sp. CA-052675]|uniref:chorismate--pyruvate lyase family protein n=1 Tax=Dactylosporangium sp. CA-052675 TaxID=3239927 RepID=UPI003D930FAA
MADPGLTRRFVAQHERPAGAAALDFAALSPYHRCLLVTDGTVTSLLEAYALEAVRTRCLDRAAGRLTPVQQRWLRADARAATLARRVVIEGVRSNAAYLSASSVLIPDRLPPDFVAALAHEHASIGSALIGAAVEHRRELLWFDRPAGTVASRTYRVFIQGRPALLITEEFLR